MERFDSVAGLSFLHSFARLANGNVLATFQSHGPSNEGPGGIAELDERGRVVRSRSAADATADRTALRPYSLAVVPSLDRVVVALTYMPIPTWHPLRGSIAHDHAGNQVQVYRLSDLALLKTIKLPTNDAPNEPRVLQDGRTVLVNTGVCRLYHVTGLDGTDPGLEMVHHEEQSGCAMPVVIGATDGSRIVVVNEPAPAAERRMWMLQIDRATGELTLDNAFRDAGSTRPGIAFDRTNWPHGGSGKAVPHGTVFGW